MSTLIPAKTEATTGEPMSISTLESPTSRRMLDEMHAEQDRRAAAVETLKAAFLMAAKACKPGEIAWFAPRVNAWAKGQPYGKRHQHFWEVMHDELEMCDFAERAMKVLMEAAQGKANQTDAQELLEAMAENWSEQNADGVM